jgi:hypothetical protein
VSSLPDLINGGFELLGGVFIALSIRKVLRDRAVAGISWLHVGFFTAWGFWNLFYYPHLDQWFSFAGGVLIVITNTVYLALLLYYSRRPWYQ